MARPKYGVKWHNGRNAWVGYTIQPPGMSWRHACALVLYGCVFISLATALAMASAN